MGEMREHADYKVTVITPDGFKMSIALDWDASATDWVRAFRAILIWQGFHGATVDGVLKEEE